MSRFGSCPISLNFHSLAGVILGPATTIGQLLEQEAMSMSLEAARTFIRRCQTELKWDNLSNVTVMDVGCGYFLECCTALLEQFPDVEKVIGLDSDVRVFGSKLSNEVVEKFKEKIQFQNSNIEIRASLQEFEGKINKIVSRNTLQQIQNKELALENMFHMLEPGGQAGILFYLNSLLTPWLQKIASSRWKKYHRGSICPFFPGNLDKEYYKDVLEKIGFKDVRSERKDTIIEYNPGQENFENLLQVREQSFAIPESLKNRFKRETLKFLAELLDGPETGPLHYTSREIYLFAVKPFDSNVSEVEKPST